MTLEPSMTHTIAAHLLAGEALSIGEIQGILGGCSHRQALGLARFLACQRSCA